MHQYLWGKHVCRTKMENPRRKHSMFPCALRFFAPSRAALPLFITTKTIFEKHFQNPIYARCDSPRWHFPSRVGWGFERCCCSARYNTRAPRTPSAHTKLHTLALLSLLCSRKMSIIRAARVSPVLLLIRRCHCSSAPIRTSLWGWRIWITRERNYSITETARGNLILSFFSRVGVKLNAPNHPIQKF